MSADNTRIIKMIMPSLIVLLFLNKYNVPRPAFTTRPDTNAPKGIAPLIYRLEIRALEAQLGIKPIRRE